MSEPKFSVCIPTRNHAPFLRTALESVLAQTVEDLEVVVYDDASDDETREVALGVDDARIRYLRHSRPVGVAANRNACLKEARGRYVGWLDSDDSYFPEMLERQASVLDRHPRVGLVHGGFEVMAENGHRLPDWPPPFDHDVVEAGQDAFRELVLDNYVAAPTVLVRREVHELAGPYATDIGRSSTDWEMWLRIALLADVAYTSTTVARYRYHGGSISAVTESSGERLRCDIRVVRRALRGRDPKADAGLRRKAGAALAAKALLRAGDAFTLGRRREALRAAALALRLDRRLAARREGGALLAAIACAREPAVHALSRSLQRRVYEELEGTRFGERIRKLAVADPAWERELTEIASTVRRVVPPEARVAVIDKQDPTIMTLSGRRGWHFPDRRLQPGGYPPDSERAISHLEELRARGAGYLVVPSAAFWWLDHYRAFGRRLDTAYRRTWADEQCVIYDLAGKA